MEIDPEIDEARLRHDALKRAHAFRLMLETPGWAELYRLQTAWLDKAREDVRKMPTTGPAAMDALRRWQIAEDLIELQARFINNTLAEAEEIRGSLTIEEALFMGAKEQ